MDLFIIISLFFKCNYFWSLSNTKMTDKSISVMPSDYLDLPKNIAGVCSDNIGYYRDAIQSE